MLVSIPLSLRKPACRHSYLCLVMQSPRVTSLKRPLRMYIRLKCSEKCQICSEKLNVSGLALLQDVCVGSYGCFFSEQFRTSVAVTKLTYIYRSPNLLRCSYIDILKPVSPPPLHEPKNRRRMSA